MFDIIKLHSLALTSFDSVVFCSQLLSLVELFCLLLLANANSFICRLTAIALYACWKMKKIDC